MLEFLLVRRPPVIQQDPPGIPGNLDSSITTRSSSLHASSSKFRWACPIEIAVHVGRDELHRLAILLIVELAASVLRSSQALYDLKTYPLKIPEIIEEVAGIIVIIEPGLVID